MTSPAAAALRDELETALASLVPMIRGLDVMTRASLKDETMNVVQVELRDRQRRRDLIDEVLKELTRLEADGYPELPKAELSAEAYRDLQEELADYAIAGGEFVPTPIVSQGTVTFPEATPKL